MMALRPILPDDLDALELLCRDHAAYEGLRYEPADQVARWHALFFGHQPQLFGWVVAEGRKLFGYMTATIDTATWSARPFVYLDCLYLKPRTRRQGFGKQMIETLQGFARQNACAEIQWQTPPDNDIGRAFYRALKARELPKSRYTLEVAHVDTGT